MRRMIRFDCHGEQLSGTLDEGSNPVGLLIVSGGNEIRSGAHSGQAIMAAHFAAMGHPVLRYDRRGVGDSEGDNGGFESSGPDITAAAEAMRREMPSIQRLVAFGNCDAASALALFHSGTGIDALLLANPWVIEASGEEGPTRPSAAAIRSRYWNRLKNPRSLLDLLSGKIDLKKLAGGLVRAAQQEKPSGLAARVADALSAASIPATILIAERDTTAMAFMTAWQDQAFATVRAKTALRSFATASHSFADAASKTWLLDQIKAALASQ